eukprot:13064988-Alexandrium_andersonii.AAC.1
MLLEQMRRSTTLSSLVAVYQCGDKSLRTYGTLIGALEQWLDRERVSQFTDLERATEEERRRAGALAGVGIAGYPLPPQQP